MKKYLLLALTLLSLEGFAQTEGHDFKAIDEYIKGLGAMEGMSTATINNVVINHFDDKIDKLRAIYTWIALNISYDVKAARTNNTQKNKPAEVLATRRAIGLGFASLFQDMCSSANIRCLTVDGFVKVNSNEIGDRATDPNHTWVVVQLGQSPDTWYYVDPAWGSGYPDADMKTFTKAFTGAYFFPDKSVFNMQHFPVNEAWKLGAGPRGKKDFYELPLIKVAAVEQGMKKCEPNNGRLKSKLGKQVFFTYLLNGKEEISKVSLILGEKKKMKQKDIDFVYSGGTLNFSYKFGEDGNFPLTVLVNGREFVTYSAEIE